MNRGMGSGLPMSMPGIDAVVLRKRWIWVVLYVYVFRFFSYPMNRSTPRLPTILYWSSLASPDFLNPVKRVVQSTFYPQWIDLHCWSLSVASSGNFWNSGKPNQPTSSRFLTWLKGRVRMVSFSLPPSSLLALSESPLRLLLDRHHLIQI